jgi:hypothetical protein
MSVPLARRYSCSGGGGSGNITVDVSCNLDLSSTNEYLATLTNMDAFGRLRVSNPYTLFEFNSINGKGTSAEGVNIIDEEVSGSGTSTWMPESYINMDVSGTGHVIRQSHEYIVYQPGKSKLVYMTGVMYHTGGINTTTGLVSRMGSFDTNMGVFLECSGGNMFIVMRKAGTDTRIERSLWNLDQLNKTGPCPTDVSFNNAQIFALDFEWLGVGRVRCGVVVGGILYYFHEFRHINELDYPYIRTAKLPLRYEIRGTANTRNSMHMICGTVISEGGFSPMTRSFWYPKVNGLRSLNVDVLGKPFIPFITLRLHNSYPQHYGTIKIKRVDIFSTDASKYGAWQLVLGGSHFSGPPGTFLPYDSTSSIAEINAGYTNDSRWSGGKVIASDFYATRTNSIQISSTDELIQAPPICFNQLTNTSDTVTLLVNTISGGTNEVYASINWIEIM